MTAAAARRVGDTWTRERTYLLNAREMKLHPEKVGTCSEECPGWAIFERSDSGILEIERCDECGVFEDDADAEQVALAYIAKNLDAFDLVGCQQFILQVSIYGFDYDPEPEPCENPECTLHEGADE